MKMSSRGEQFEGGNKVIEYLGERIILDQTVDSKRERFDRYKHDAQQQRQQDQRNMEMKAHMHNRFFKKMKYGTMFDRIMEEEGPDENEDSSDVSSMLQSEEDEQILKPKKSGVRDDSDDDSNSIKSVEELTPNAARKGTRVRELKRGMTFTKNQRRRQRKKEKKKNQQEQHDKEQKQMEAF